MPEPAPPTQTKGSWRPVEISGSTVNLEFVLEPQMEEVVSHE